jgi:hypothetical protein
LNYVIIYSLGKNNLINKADNWRENYDTGCSGV